MLRNYLKVAFRNLSKQKAHALINIFGLSLGIAGCTLTILFLQNELTYDRHHKNLDRIYRLESHYKEMDFSSTPDPLGPALVEAFPEVVSTCRLWTTDAVIQSGEDFLKERLHFVDPTLFESFDFPLQAGQAGSALTNVNSVVLSNVMAAKYFPDQEAVGKVLRVNLADQFHDFLVTGVAKAIPKNSSIKFDFLLPFASGYLVRGEPLRTKWMSFGITTLILLQRPQDVKIVVDKLDRFIASYMGEAIQADNQKVEDFSFVLQPLADYHLSGQGKASGLEDGIDPVYLAILAAIAVLVLLIACFNYTNLTIGQASGRFKEVGMRKVVGAQRRHLVRQFWLEALCVSFFSLIVGVTLAELCLPGFNELTGGKLSIELAQHLWLMMALLGLTTLVGIGAGSYPALVLSGFRVTEIFRGKLKVGGKNMLTHTLVCAQFCLSIILILAAIIMNSQQSFMRNASLGFDKDQVVVIPTQLSRGQEEGGDRFLKLFKNELNSAANIVSVTGTSNSFARGTSASFKTKGDGSRTIVFQSRVDADYIPTLDMQLVSGRNFSHAFQNDFQESVIVNEAFLREFAIEEPAGYSLPRPFAEIDQPKIVGVVKDYHYQRLKSKIYPMVLYMAKAEAINYILVKIIPTDVDATIAQLRRVWKKLQPAKPFEYSFLDEDIDRQYRTEKNWSRAVGYASACAVLIACLGLLGLTMLTVTRRTKEIGIRKVLGASVTGIVRLLSREFASLIILSNVLAWPIAYYFLNGWLQQFAYRIDLGVGYFLLAGCMSITIALVTVSFQSIRAAAANPVKSLRYE